MSEEVVVYKSIQGTKTAAALLTIVLAPLAYFTATWIFPSQISQQGLIFMVFLGIPLLITAIGIFLGSNAKDAIEYNAPEWKHEPIQISIDDAKNLIKTYRQKYRRLTPNGYFWYFYTPLLLILASIGVPLYATLVNMNYLDYVAPFFTVVLPLLFVTATLLGFLASSNAASADFTLPLIREVIWIGKQFAKVGGTPSINVLLDRAENVGFEVYANPRILARIEGIERDAYIEAWSGELGSVETVLCRLHASEDHPIASWWWMSQDRLFRKYVDQDKEGYYVKYPVPSIFEEVGVKDVALLFKNSIAIIVLEWLSIHGERSDLSEILSNFGVS